MMSLHDDSPRMPESEDTTHNSEFIPLRFTVQVPATSANMGPGFDCMGVALGLANEMVMETGVPFSVSIEGESANLLPTDETNVVVQTIRRVMDEAGIGSAVSSTARSTQPWRLHMVNRIPVGSGLGSSASAIVGGLLLGNAWLEAYHPAAALSRNDILKLAIDIEGHPDNVTPALLGGACLSCPDDTAMRTFPIPVPGHLHFVVAVPYFTLYTEESRKVVPTQMSRGDVVFNVAQASRLMLAMSSGDLSILRGGFADRIHEPYRQKLIPGYADVRRAAMKGGAITVTLSGAGPSMLAWCDEEHTAWQVADQMTLAWREYAIPCRAEVYSAARAETRVSVDPL